MKQREFPILEPVTILI